MSQTFYVFFWMELNSPYYITEIIPILKRKKRSLWLFSCQAFFLICDNTKMFSQQKK